MLERPDEDWFASGCLLALVLLLEAGYLALVMFSLMLRGLGGTDPGSAKPGSPPPAPDWTEVWCWGGGAGAALFFGAVFLWLRRPWAASFQLFAAVWAATLAAAAWQRVQT
ncbi:inner-membrane translocator [Streptomyces sp. NPDC046716]|uniref:inner-membrane translocator n=1 Tax=Streptomyces sp. NPDC046716 TaxID=3157093 RepID=UPI0033CF36EB